LLLLRCVTPTLHAVLLSLSSPPRPPPPPTLFPYTTLFRSHCPAPGRAPSRPPAAAGCSRPARSSHRGRCPADPRRPAPRGSPGRSEEHTSELQSRFDLVCRLLLEKKK